MYSIKTLLFCCATLLLLTGVVAPVRAQEKSAQPAAPKTVPKPRPEVTALLVKAQALSKQNKWLDAIDGYDEAIALARSLKDQEGEALALNAGAFTCLNAARLPKAMDEFQQAAIIFKTTGDRNSEARVYVGMSIVFARRGHHKKALDALGKALPIYESAGNMAGKARVLDNRGMIYRDVGATQKALTSYQEAMTIFRKISDKAGQANVLIGLGNIYSSTGQAQRALENYHQALPIFEQLRDSKNKAITFQNIGMIYLSFGQNEKALDYFSHGLSLNRAIRDRIGIARSLQNLGIAYRNVGQLDKSLDYLQQALLIFKSIGETDAIARALANIGIIHRDTRQFEKALDYFQQALPLFAATSDRNGRANTLHNLAIVVNSLNRPQEALAYSRKAVLQLEQLRSSLGGYTEAKTYYLASKLYIYYYCINLLIEQGHSEEAFDLAQKTKIRALLDLLASGHVDLSAVLTAEEGRQEQELRQRADYLNTQMVKEGVENEVGSKARFTDLQEQLKHTESELQILTDTLYARYPTLSAKRPARTVTLAGISRLLPSDTSLLEYIQVSREKLVLFAITTNGGSATVQTYSIAAKYTDLQKLCADLRTACSDPKKSWQDASEKAYRLLVAPAEVQLSGKTRLIVCPDGALWDVPFTALTDGGGKLLLDRFEIDMAYSCTAMQAALKARAAHKLPAGTLLAFANPDFGTTKRFGDLDKLPGLNHRDTPSRTFDTPSRTFDTPSRTFDTPSRAFDIPSRTFDTPSRAFDAPSRSLISPNEETMVQEAQGSRRIPPLPGTQREADTLMRDFPDSKVFIGAQAQEAVAKQEMGKYRFLHFATHGFFNDSSPLLSSIVLALPTAGSKEDGFLTAREIFNLDLSRVEMTVLSACNTARGQKRAGEGVIGLTWAFFAAGCPTQVVSQWSVDDASTATLMETFYSSLIRKKQSKGAALRAAAQALRNDGQHSHPYYWAPFILVGDWN